MYIDHPQHLTTIPEVLEATWIHPLTRTTQVGPRSVSEVSIDLASQTVGIKAISGKSKQLDTMYIC